MTERQLVNAAIALGQLTQVVAHMRARLQRSGEPYDPIVIGRVRDLIVRVYADSALGEQLARRKRTHPFFAARREFFLTSRERPSAEFLSLLGECERAVAEMAREEAA